MALHEVEEALAAAQDLPEGDGKVAELERLVAHADAAEDLRLAFEARISLIEAYWNATDSWRLVPTFHWCLRTVDREPALFTAEDTERLLFLYGWAVSTATNTPRIPLADIDALLDDMERRFRAAGHSLRHVYTLRCFAVDMTRGEQQARPWFDRWRTAKRGRVGEPPGYDLNLQGALLAGWEDDTAAIPLLERVLAEGLLGGEPELPLSQLMLPYLRQGRLAEAGRAHVRTYSAQRGRAVRFHHVSDHLDFCALSGHLERGLDILVDVLPDLEKQPADDWTAMWVAASGALVCRLATDAGMGERSIAPPSDGHDPAAPGTVAALGDRLAATALAVAARFDERDGSDHNTVDVKRHLARQPLTEPFPLPGSASAAAGAEPGITSPGDGAQLDQLGPLTTEAITAVLDERGDSYRVEASGAVTGQWTSAFVQLERVGEDQTILHARVMASRTLTVDRLAEAYEFCNSWNRDTLLPKAYAHDTGDGTLILVGETNIDLAAGVSHRQLTLLVSAAIDVGGQFAAAAEQLP
ncbi:YbjN domain-containing protein [Natronosporangium hydrolyticum]|uniref:YbjN domain-containing protein n=1 Tax=Natronosporangium hydrolyticum TaxID=2811111 RepID=A0A895YN59_9ACTN|nr:YbjN domain-containing protein [Natronosporangium hydrolyticum]QSB16743.1 YbjN domain-containing protein [Natronosporangium hydrolyticum]